MPLPTGPDSISTGLTAAQAQEKLETELPAQGIEITNHTLDTQLTIPLSDLGYTAEAFEGIAQHRMDGLEQKHFLVKDFQKAQKQCPPNLQSFLV